MVPSLRMNTTESLVNKVIRVGRRPLDNLLGAGSGCARHRRFEEPAAGSTRRVQRRWHVYVEVDTF